MKQQRTHQQHPTAWDGAGDARGLRSLALDFRGRQSAASMGTRHRNNKRAHCRGVRQFCHCGHGFQEVAKGVDAPPPL